MPSKHRKLTIASERMDQGSALFARKGIILDKIRPHANLYLICANHIIPKLGSASLVPALSQSEMVSVLIQTANSPQWLAATLAALDIESIPPLKFVRLKETTAYKLLTADALLVLLGII